jgi:prophage maintenance system killer protein
MDSRIEIYQSPDHQTQVEVRFEDETVWLSQRMMADLFQKDSDTIGLHLNNIFKEEELSEGATTELFSVVQTEGKRTVTRKVKHYNLDAIISVGYRVSSKQGTQFRQWATQRLREYLVQGYTINEKRLQQKQQEVEYLKTGIRILSRAIEEQAVLEDARILHIFAKGLTLLDDFDHKQLDKQGKTRRSTHYPAENEFLNLIHSMKSEFSSDIFAKPKDQSFSSSLWQIQQTFDGEELYPSLEAKAANLLYLIVKNHPFIDGNKRIGAACFLFFLKKNEALLIPDGRPVISNEALAALTLLTASSKPEEKEVVIQLIISILNRASE